MKKITNVLYCALIGALMIACVCLAEGDGRLQRELDADGVLIEINAQVRAPEKLDAQPIDVRTMQWSAEELMEAFFPGREIQLQQEIYDAKKLIDGEFADQIIFYRNDSDEESLYCNINGLLDYTAPTFPYAYVQLIEQINAKNISERQFEDFAFADALEQVRALAGQLRIRSGKPFTWNVIDDSAYTSVYDQYAAMVDTQSDMIKEKYMASMPPSTIEEGYWMHLEVLLAGVPCIRDDYYSSLRDEPISGSSIQAYVTREGVQYFALNGEGVGYEVLGRSDSKEQASMGLDEAIERLRQKYADILINGSVIVTDIEYAYVAVPIKGKVCHFKMVPSWCFTLQHTGEESQRIMLNALTGREIR